MKTGILTWHDVPNYGSAFQAYALQQYVLQQGHDCVVLKHDRIVPTPFGKEIHIKSLKDVYNWIRSYSPNRVLNRRREKTKHNNFIDFRKNYLNVGDKYNKEEKLDVVIIGSDQIFDLKYFFYDFQFGHQIDCENINSYAPSFGETKIDDVESSKFYDSVINGVSKMNKISGRDKNSQGILQKLTKRDIPIVLDPTLLYNFKKEKKQWNLNLINEPYLIIYSWGGSTATSEFNSQVQIFAKKNNLKTVSIGDYRKWCDVNYASATPVEFFELFKHTSMVITNMFHGTCFSLLNEKPFYSLTMPHNEHKLGGLLRQFGLESQIITDVKEIGEKEIPQIQYSIVNEVIQNFRKNSENFLASIFKMN